MQQKRLTRCTSTINIFFPHFLNEKLFAVFTFIAIRIDFYCKNLISQCSMYFFLTCFSLLACINRMCSSDDNKMHVSNKSRNNGHSLTDGHLKYSASLLLCVFFHHLFYFPIFVPDSNFGIFSIRLLFIQIQL